MPRIEGLTIEIGADAKKFQAGIRGMDKSIAKAKASLKQVERALHFNPGNTELLKQKQQLLARSIDETKKKLTALKAEEDKLKNSPGFDENSEDAKKLRREIIETESKLKNLERQAAKSASIIGQKMQFAGKRMQDIGRSISGIGDRLTTRLTLPLVAMGGMAAKKFAEVDKTMQLTNATMKNTEAEAKQINSAMKEAAANSTFGMKDAANASLNFARAGLNAAQAASTLAPAMNLAAGEGGNLDTVSGGLVATINGFHDSFDDAAHYADVFANACNNSALDIDSLSSAMSVAAPVFSAAGYAVEDAALYMGVMANNGIPAKKAANALKTGLARLVKPTDEAAGYMKKLGINITNADGSMKSSVEVQEHLHNAFKDLSKSEKIAAASAIFGKNQFSPWLALIETAPGKVDELSNSLGVEGTTTEMANAMMSGFGGSLEKLKSSIDVAATSLGEALAPTIRKVSDFVQDAVDKFNALDEGEQQHIVKIGLLVAAAGPLLAIGGRLITGLGSLAMGLGKALTGITALANGTATFAAGPAIAALMAVAALGGGMYLMAKHSDEARRAEADLDKEEREHVKALNDVTDSYKEADKARKEATASAQADAEYSHELVDEYNSLVGANGKIKKGYEDRAEFIKGQLAEALGVEKKDIDDLIGKNGKLKKSINDVIEMKKAEAILDANKDAYTKAIQARKEAVEKLGPALRDLKSQEKDYEKAKAETAKRQQEYNNYVESGGKNTAQYKQRLKEAQLAEEGAARGVEKQKKAVEDYQNTLNKANTEIQNYEGLATAIEKKDTKAVQEWAGKLTTGIKTRDNATRKELEAQAKTIDEEYKLIEKAYKDGEKGITEQMVKDAKKRRDAANKEAGITAKDAAQNEKKVADSATKSANKGQEKVASAWNTMLSKTRSTFGKIPSTTKDSMDKASNEAGKGANKIKSKFPVNVGKAVKGSVSYPDMWAKIKEIGKGVAKALFPQISTTIKTLYFAKAYDNPMLFTSPSLYGGAVFGDRGAHAGGEVVYGRDNLMRDIQQAVGGGRSIVINMTVNGAENPRQIATQIAQELEIATRAI